MARYIDTQKIKFSGKTFDDGIGDKLVLLDDVRMAIEQTPTEDVVKVVRCKDCKYRGTFFNSGTYICEGNNADPYECPVVYDNDFCSKGEIK